MKMLNISDIMLPWFPFYNKSLNTSKKTRAARAATKQLLLRIRSYLCELDSDGVHSLSHNTVPALIFVKGNKIPTNHLEMAFTGSDGQARHKQCVSRSFSPTMSNLQ